MILEEFLKPLAMTQTEFAQRIGVAWTRANQIINGRRGVTPDTALRLEKLFGMPAEFWLTMQLRWDLYHAMRSPNAKEIDKIRRAPGLEKSRKSA
jgi:addiction module HigA family antidote